MEVRVLIVAILMFHFGRSDDVIAKYVTVCKRSDPNIGKCYVNNFNLMMAHMEKGMPELGLRQIDPVKIVEIKLSLGSGSSKFDVVLNDLMMYGLKDTKATKMSMNLETLQFQLENTVPQVYLVAKYRGKGRVLLFDLDSSGMIYVNISDVTSVLTGKNPKTREKDGKTYASWDFDVDVALKKIYTHFDNLLPNEEMNKNVNDALNANMDLLYQELKPTLQQSMLAIVSDLTNNFYNRFALEDLFPK